MTSIACIIVGIDGYKKYTAPLVDSLTWYEPDIRLAVIDNASTTPYPDMWSFIHRTKRLCYSAAINHGKAIVGDADWYIVLSNDVLCTGAFAHLLAPLTSVVAGPQLWHEHGLSWIVGWCVAIPRAVWDDIGGWDENFIMSSWEDVSYSTTALEKGYQLKHMPDLPFVHLDQKQRFGLPGYAGSEAHNYHYFAAKHNKAYA